MHCYTGNPLKIAIIRLVVFVWFPQNGYILAWPLKDEGEIPWTSSYLAYGLDHWFLKTPIGCFRNPAYKRKVDQYIKGMLENIIWAVFFFNVPCPIHWVNAYANASACLRGLQRVPTPEVFNTRCLRGCLRGVLCWMAMLVVKKYFPKQFTVGVLNATLDLAALVLVGVATFLGRWSRCLRAASAEPTRAYAVEPRQIPRNHLSHSHKFICITSCTYSGNYTYIYA